MKNHDPWEIGFKKLESLIKQNKENEHKYRLVSGIKKNRSGDAIYGSSWIESDDEVIDFDIESDGYSEDKYRFFTMKKAEYYRCKKVEEVIPYTFHEAIEYNTMMKLERMRSRLRWIRSKIKWMFGISERKF